MSACLPSSPLPPAVQPTLLRDTRGRALRDLRISVTDRCNFRCTYCMPKEVFGKDHVYLPRSALLDFEEITRLARLFIAHGVGKIRLTGGEPLLRKDLGQLIGQLAALTTLEGQPLEVTLTTNGSLLQRQARSLKNAGLSRLSISLDSLDDATFRRMNDVDFPVTKVLDGIAAAQAAGFERIKVNMVVKRSTNEHDILPMAAHFRGTGVTLRFIDAGEVFPAERLALARGDERFDVDPLAESGRGLRLILRAVDFFDVEMNAGKNITTLMKALPDPAVNYSTDKNGG